MTKEIPLALDERIGEFFKKQRLISQALEIETFLSNIRDLNIKALIIKAGNVGGWDKSATLASSARHDAIDSVMSSSFESSLGIHYLALFINLYHIRTPAGLATLPLLNNDIYKNPLSIKENQLYFPLTPPDRNDLNLFSS